MGADEVTCSDVNSDTDWTCDGIVNMIEFAMFSDAWLSNNTSDNWNSYCDFDSDNDVDLADLAALANDWLWTACRRESSAQVLPPMMAGDSGGGTLSSATTEATSLTSIESQPLPVEITLAEKIANLTAILDYLKEVSQDEETQETITEQQLQKFIDDVIDILDDLKTNYDDN